MFETFIDFKEKYYLEFPKEYHETLLDIFNNEYNIDDVKEDNMKKYVYAWKLLLVNNDETQFLNILNELIDMKFYDAYFGLIKYYIDKIRPDKVIKYCDFLTDNSHKMDVVFGVIANTFYKFDLASEEIIIDFYQKAIASGNNSISDNFGDLYLKKGDFKKALEYFLNVEYKINYIYYKIGLCYYYLNEFEKVPEYITPAKEYGNILSSLLLYHDGNIKGALDKLLNIYDKEYINNDLREIMIEKIISYYEDLDDYEKIISFLEPLESKTSYSKLMLGKAYIITKKDEAMGYKYIYQSYTEGNEIAEKIVKTIMELKKNKE